MALESTKQQPGHSHYGLNPGQLADVACRAQHFYERVEYAARLPRLQARTDSGQLDETLQAWCDASAAGDTEGFERRLAQDGISREQLRTALLPAEWPTEALLPEWCDMLSRVLSRMDDYSDIPLVPDPSDSHLYPFYQVLLPFIETAQIQLEQTLTVEQSALLPAALSAALEHLANRLCHQASLALQLEFTVFLSRRESSLGRVLRQSARQADAAASTQYYTEFVNHFYQQQWPLFLQEYPVLARQLAECCCQWVTTTHALLRHWFDDRSQLCATFAIAADDQPVSIKPGQSDRHNHGRSTVFIELASGRRLVYKPKPLHTDALIDDLYEWLNSMPGALPMRHIKTLNCGDYGWQEWVEHEPCQSIDEVKQFYQRTGYLLALIYALEGYDYHHENIIASGSMPMLVDTETIFNPYKEMERVATDQADAATLASESVFYSVIRTGLLPAWTVRDNGSHQDLSGLGSGDQSDSDPYYLSRWVNANTDDMRLESVQEAVKPKGNRPALLNGQGTAIVVKSEDYVAELRQGFMFAYHCLLRDREGFMSRLRRHADIPVRFVRKATRIYSSQLWRLQKPACLRDGMEWSRCVEFQSRMFVAANSPNHAVWNLLRSEYRALMATDIPYFKVPANDRCIQNGFGRTVVPAYFTRSCIERLEDKIQLLNARDLALQDRYIAYSFYARAARNIHSMAPEMAQAEPVKERTADNTPASAEQCLKYAREIGDELLKEALHGPDGSMAWVALEYLKEAEVFQLKPISYNLYSGSMGVAVLLAALGKVSGEQLYTAAAHATLKPLLRIVRKEHNDVVRLSGSGIGVGLGSLIYGLLVVAELSDDELAASYRTMACDCALSVDAGLLTQDRKYDLIFGSAGALLALCKLVNTLSEHLPKASNEKARVQERIHLLADHLLANRTAEQVVSTYQGKAVTGFSHGAAGVALALARAGQCTGEQRYLDAAMQQVDYEEAQYDTEQGNYPDYRSQPDAPAFLTTWCHGSPGIGLSRLKHYYIAGDRSLLAAADTAMQKTHAFTLMHLDHICCGTLGRLDIQLEYAQHFANADYQLALQRDLTAILEQRQRLGGFRLFVNAPTQVFAPGLFTGAAGIAYTLLRFAAPGSLPCILAFD